MRKRRTTRRPLHLLRRSDWPVSCEQLKTTSFRDSFVRIDPPSLSLSPSHLSGRQPMTLPPLRA